MIVLAREQVKRSVVSSRIRTVARRWKTEQPFKLTWVVFLDLFCVAVDFLEYGSEDVVFSEA